MLENASSQSTERMSNKMDRIVGIPITIQAFEILIAYCIVSMKPRMLLSIFYKSTFQLVEYLHDSVVNGAYIGWTDLNDSHCGESRGFGEIILGRQESIDVHNNRTMI
jgi:hypothetical protein